MDKFDLPEKEKPQSDADLYEGEQLPDPTAAEEFVGGQAVWSKDISELRNEKGKKTDRDLK